MVTEHNPAYLRRLPLLFRFRVKGRHRQTDSSIGHPHQCCCSAPRACSYNHAANTYMHSLILDSWIRSVKYEDSALTLSLLTGSLQAPCVAVFPSYPLLKLLAWLCSLPGPCSAVAHTALFMDRTLAMNTAVSSVYACGKRSVIQCACAVECMIQTIFHH